MNSATNAVTADCHCCHNNVIRKVDVTAIPYEIFNPRFGGLASHADPLRPLGSRLSDTRNTITSDSTYCYKIYRVIGATLYNQDGGDPAIG